MGEVEVHRAPHGDAHESSDEAKGAGRRPERHLVWNVRKAPSSPQEGKDVVEASPDDDGCDGPENVVRNLVEVVRAVLRRIRGVDKSARPGT